MGIGSNRGVIANKHIKIGSNSYEKLKTFKYLDPLLRKQNSIQEEIKCGLKPTLDFLRFRQPKGKCNDICS